MQNHDAYPQYPVEIDGVGRGILQNPQAQDEPTPTEESQPQQPFDDNPQGEVKNGRNRKPR